MNEAMQENYTTICVQKKIPWSLFLEANPSVSADKCNDNLDNGFTYYAGPTYGWDLFLDRDDWEEEL
ncbi:CAZyme family GH55 [Penicillium canescens]|uniref:CAZyme family GH55 n=1 Tax=Penicillium canescens TaxID=5083 RepID=A0AAD6N652_PENCN|nr:CAZyme family GH55 [Penicillium canescens]KAJ6002064.1 CAZyme family GH55 [Penicillium canescens]KAJ6034854.1 CAZyme family GH55 [Penicillium canescens]KAJ6046518.1 CAZyme family GH55 [Penicillium canescens]KAJ6053598.1 CAZyme family GH55 [Penicillium canescens]KAJ6097697.1 CAZyme family GH55 [Penicillium canescens]